MCGYGKVCRELTSGYPSILNFSTDFFEKDQLRVGIEKRLYSLLDVLGLEATLIAPASGRFQLEEYQLHEAGVALQVIAIWVVDHQKGLRSAVISSVPDSGVDGYPATEQSRARPT